MLLCQLAQGEMSVSELEEALGIRQPTLSQQLTVLRDEELVDTRREGKYVYYSVRKDLRSRSCRCCTTNSAEEGRNDDHRLDALHALGFARWRHSHRYRCGDAGAAERPRRRHQRHRRRAAHAAARRHRLAARIRRGSSLPPRW